MSSSEADVALPRSCPRHAARHGTGCAPPRVPHPRYPAPVLPGPGSEAGPVWQPATPAPARATPGLRRLPGSLDKTLVKKRPRASLHSSPRLRCQALRAGNRGAALHSTARDAGSCVLQRGAGGPTDRPSPAIYPYSLGNVLRAMGRYGDLSLPRGSIILAWPRPMVVRSPAPA